MQSSGSKLCEGWDLNPRTPARLAPEPDAVDLAWLPLLYPGGGSGRAERREYSCNNIVEIMKLRNGNYGYIHKFIPSNLINGSQDNF
jgi:hypothetical protein